MKRTLETFISDARKIHGGKYDYSKSMYNGVHTKLIITCPIHGDFQQRPNDHLHGQGCKECGKLSSGYNRRLGTDSFKRKFNELYGNSYDLSEFTYVKSSIKSTVICSKHGRFEASPNNLLCGRGCPKCGNESKRTTQSIKEQVFSNRIESLYGSSITYDFRTYVNNSTKMSFMCNEHGEFKALPLNVMRGHGCPTCGKAKYSSSRTTKWYDALSKMVATHGDMYKYNESTYVSPKVKMEIVCKRHGVFMQTPINHWRGQGCPKCNESHLERDVSNALESNGIDFIYQRRIGRQSVDFYIPSLRLNIECQGEQHFKRKFNDKYDFKKSLERDIKKYNEILSLGEEIIYFTNERLIADVNIHDEKFGGIYNGFNLTLSLDELISYIANKSSYEESKVSSLD